MDITPHARFARPISSRRCGAAAVARRDAEEETDEAGIRIAPGALLTSARRLLSGDLAHSIAVSRSSRGGAGRSLATGGRAGGKRRADTGLLRRARRKDGGDCGAQSGGGDHCGGVARTSRKGAERAGCSDERAGGDGQCDARWSLRKSSTACWPMCRAAAPERWRRNPEIKWRLRAEDLTRAERFTSVDLTFGGCRAGSGRTAGVLHLLAGSRGGRGRCGAGFTRVKTHFRWWTARACWRS